MKKLLLYSIVLVVFSVWSHMDVHAQGIGINASGTNPDSSALLDLSSTTKGILITRMTTTQRNAITNPAQSLLIFNTTTSCFETFVNGFWQSLFCAACPTPTGATASASPGALCEGGTLSLTGNATNATSWSWTGPNSFSSTLQNPTLTNITTAGSGVYTLTVGNTCGSATAVNTTSVTVNSLPTAPTATAHTPSQTQITWNWNAVAGATGYKYSITNNYLSATDNGTNLSYSQSGLACNTPCTLYVWAYNSCGNSSSTTLSQTTSSCVFACGSGTVSFTYRSGTVTYGTVAGVNGTCWLDRNLGASQVGTSVTDVLAYGDMFQWGRGDDGHQLRTPLAGTTTTQSSTDQPGHANFITVGTNPVDWRIPQNSNLWQGVSGINNPCPSGWRLPTETEMTNERNSWSSQNSAGAFASPLRWVCAGYRLNSGTLNGAGTEGTYWSSSTAAPYSRTLYFYNTGVIFYSNDRACGLPVRCIKN